MNHAENPENPLRYTKTATLFVSLVKLRRVESAWLTSIVWGLGIESSISKLSIKRFLYI